LTEVDMTVQSKEQCNKTRKGSKHCTKTGNQTNIAQRRKNKQCRIETAKQKLNLYKNHLFRLKQMK
jgi:hypothetical protein